MTHITALPPAVNRPEAGLTSSPPEADADHDSAPPLAVRRTRPAPLPRSAGHETAGSPSRRASATPAAGR
ncbi:hypothetical protein, partial [Streptosporangium sandarakinum]